MPFGFTLQELAVLGVIAALSAALWFDRGPRYRGLRCAQWITLVLVVTWAAVLALYYASVKNP